MSVRDFVNEGGRVSVSGVNAGRQWDLVEYPTEGLPNSYCDGDLQTTDNGKCNPLSNDFAQYYLGAYLRSDAGGQDQDGNIFPVAGTPGGPLDGLTFDLNGADSAGNQGGSGLGTGNFLVTSSVLPRSTTRSSRATRRPTGSCRAARRSTRTRDRSTCTPSTRIRATSA